MLEVDALASAIWRSCAQAVLLVRKAGARYAARGWAGRAAWKTSTPGDSAVAGIVPLERPVD